MALEGRAASVRPRKEFNKMDSPNATGGAQTPAAWTVVGDYLKISRANQTKMVAEQTLGFNAELKKIASDAILGKMGKTHFDGLKSLSRLVEYDGFNPLTIIRLLSERALNHNLKNTDDSDYSLAFEGQTITIPKAAKISEDVALFITVFLTRGNNMFKILKTVSKDMKEVLSKKMLIYGIKSDDDSDAAARRRKEKVTLASTDITLSRIAASYPHLTLAVAKRHNIEGKANLLAITECYKAAGGAEGVKVPIVLQHGLIPSLLSRQEPVDQTNMRKFCYMFNLEQSMTLQPPSIKRIMMQEPLAVHIESSIKFVQAAINGPLNSETIRTELKDAIFNADDSEDLTRLITAGAVAWDKLQNAANYSSFTLGLADQNARAKELANAPKPGAAPAADATK